MPAYPIIRLGCTTIDPRQAATYLAWAARNGQIDAGCCFDVDNAGCWADQPTTAYTDPTTDCAAWVDLNYAEAADFLGVYATSVQGFDDTVSSRESVQLVEGGAAATAPIVGGRGIRIKGYLLASSCAGMEWGKQWWRRTLDEVCRWGGGSAAGACSTGLVSVRVFCPPDGGDETDGIRDLVNVSLASAPSYRPIDDVREELACTCTRLAFECVLLAGRPELFRPPADVIARTAFAGSLDYAALACDPTPVTIPTEPDCVATGTPPDADAVLPDYDDQGRPSCGTGSAYYDSGVEADFEDERGHPSSGDGSGHYLRTPGELPVLDWLGRPSCGTGSANYGLEPATSAIVSEQLYASNTVGTWVARTTSIRALTYLQCTNATITFAGAGSVRDIHIKAYAINEFAAVPQLQVGEQWVGGVSSLPITTRVVGYRYTFEIAWEEKIDTGQSVTLSWSVALQSALNGPNAGVDRNCAAQILGPNAGVDRTGRTECVSRLAALATTITPAAGAAGHQGNATAPAALIPFNVDEGDRFFGTLDPSGGALVQLGGFDQTALCAGSTILWARLRVKFKSPAGVGGAPYPWTLAAYQSLAFIGGRVGTLDQVDGTTDLLFPINMAASGAVTVQLDIHGPIGGTEGWLDYLALEVEYVGGPTCIDCGPNAGVDVPCAAEATTSCYERPATVALASGRFVPPTIAAGAPVITIEAGTADLENVAMFAWVDPLNRTAPTASQDAFDFWRCVTPCTTAEVAWVPAGGVLTIDARSRSITLAVNGLVVEASRYVTGRDGEPWSWPAWSVPVRAAVIAPSTVSATARVTVAAAIAEGV